MGERVSHLLSTRPCINKYDKVRPENIITGYAHARPKERKHIELTRIKLKCKESTTGVGQIEMYREALCVGSGDRKMTGIT